MPEAQTLLVKTRKENKNRIGCLSQYNLFIPQLPSEGGGQREGGVVKLEVTCAESSESL